MKIYIKNMVSQRCKTSVGEVLDQLGLAHGTLELGEVDVTLPLSEQKLEQLKAGLLARGFGLLESHKSILLEKIRNTVIEMVRGEELPKMNFSAYLSSKLHYDYTYLANIFSEARGTSIERFIIIHKIERVKELLQDGELSLKEISYKLNYCSVSHLSAQFKKIAGVTPSRYKKEKFKVRQELENL